MSKDFAETGDFQSYLSKIGAGLDEFVKFEHEDALAPGKVWREKLSEPLPQQGVGLEAVSELLVHDVIANGSAIIRPGFTSFITTGGTTASAIASVAGSIGSPQRYTLNAFNFLEELSLEWLAQMCGVPDMKGIYSTGGSVANLIALGGARQWAFEQVGHDVSALGIDRPTRIYASAECHHTIQRSAGVLGLGRRSVRLIQCDAQKRMLPEALAAAIKEDLAANVLPIAIVANTGSTNTGAIDPIKEIGEIARANKIWFHVDGAYGLPGILDERIAHLYEGLELADSVIVDPHKWLGACVGIAATFIRDREILHRAFTQEPADYLEGSVDYQDGANAPSHSMDDFGIPYFDFGVELSAPPRGVAVWAMLKEIGVDGMRQRIKRHNDMAQRVAERVRADKRLELVLEPSLSICCFRYVAPGIEDLNTFNQRIHRRLVRGNVYIPSTTKVGDVLALRPCFVGARSVPGQDDGLVDEVLRLGDELLAEQAMG
ncbi:aminotransferase class V-fold PLP-dependent enzyme [Maritalea porphyrae]|jgi:aromatic-L-amino-acid decarboxylase|uniref:pyridoxal phosphate-dependent decarboxylase family protein n=1 Tax=Maritalea porphyrae TaxID=880732 RepID=UPI0022AFC3FA|nr:aminotransferase class V-fold PLP-dependent enzyme [Maritalea porphyrae]MCZ4271575.1 aminotransferase class V-fold PLP-dependent enzyme [Maritalea porphyrae]